MTDTMALACHEGRKTVTRRPAVVGGHILDGPDTDGFGAIIPGAGTATVGGRVWVRECFAIQIGDVPLCGSISGMSPPRGLTLKYRASGDGLRPAADGWRPSIHMPKWAARTWGRITSVRPERLQAITDEDAQREGFSDGGCLNCGESSWPKPCGCEDPQPDHVDAFVEAWNSIYEPRGLGWHDDPWVWRIEWERIQRPEVSDD